MESVIIPRPAVWALGQGETWQPAVVDDRVVDDVREAIVDAVPLDDEVRGIDAAPGRQAEVAVVVALVPGLARAAVDDAVRRVHEALAHRPWWPTAWTAWNCGSRPGRASAARRDPYFGAGVQFCCWGTSS